MEPIQPAVQWPTWEAPLRRFAEATGLVVSGFDAQGVRQLGPFTNTPLGELLTSSRLFSADGAALPFERDLSVQAVRTGTADALFETHLCVHAVPLNYANQVVGSITFGWVLADFATSVGSERLAQVTGLDSRVLWRIARMETPVSLHRMATYAALLSTLLDTGAQLRAAVDDLERIGKAREEFLAHVSHDLRTPLSAIAMRLHLLLTSKLDDPAAIRGSLEAMRRNVREESRLIEDLLDAAVSSTGRFTVTKSPTDLAVITRAAFDSIAPTAESRGVNLNLQSGSMGGSLPLVADATRLQQALWNVISNAVKFTPSGGNVEVRTSDQGNAYAIEVIDEGPGIPADILPNIFSPFTRTKVHNAQGLGLGLSIAHQIVELHGGSITANSTSEPSRTTFTIVLPSAP